MAVNQAKIFEHLEQLVENPEQDEFIYGFLTAFEFPKSTLSQIRQGGTRNVAKEPGHVALKNKLYYQPVADTDDFESAFEQRIADSAVAKNKIRFVLVTNFVRFLALDTLTQERLDIEFEELPRNYGFFLPLVGLEKAILNSENPADVKAAEKMGKLFDLIKERNDLSKAEDIHALNVFLTRLLFCFFAEDTGIFEKGQFTSSVKSYTAEDGSDLDQFLTDLFAVMNSKPNSKLRLSLPIHLTAFPYVNGGLFDSDEPVPELGLKGRRILLECSAMDWSEINPDIFGSMFQAVIDVEQRSRLGQHYTSYSNIMKVIQPLFLEPLRSELEKQRTNTNGLKRLLLRLGKMKVFDPACGSGNFLIVAYKELRLLEMDVIQALLQCDPQSIFMSGIHLDQFYGIEIDDFACEIARLSLWLAEHQLNKQWEEHIGSAPPALPLRSSGKIWSGNSLQTDWQTVCPKGADDEVYIIGNPPFLGTSGRSDEQRADMQAVFSGFKSLGGLDFVACWFWKGAQYIQNSRAELALVATNSLCQGEQVATLWPSIFELGLSIHFAYPTFRWENNARDKAAVHVVIIGLSGVSKIRQLYQQVDGKWHSKQVSNISPYLVEGSNVAVEARIKPIVNGVPPLLFGNKPTDGGHLLMTGTERDALLKQEPQAAPWIKKVLGADEFLNGQERWCLWLVDINITELQLMQHVYTRVQKVAEMRRKSAKISTQKKSNTPHLFDENRQPTSGDYILIPSVSSERRTYVPIGFYDASVISTNLNYILPNGSLYEFAILASIMHNDWMRLVAGRLESRYRYSAKVVYNSFPWPDVTDVQRKNLISLAKTVLLMRENYPEKTLAELYDPLKMPIDLLEAHQALDKAVDRLYRDKPFKDSSERLSCLLERYELLTKV
ncbi:class I SAM-dependent DNA methyltransferase [Klebsiella quasipneumoniae]|uniref:class I SAM-dependent DNA methyltransferase n=1 Tax=Klebsiella quasipneumoniae TaxID=1463165 RepID=UPI0010F83697|nr:DNA methyltransferase [Klebsiella quasipneumoniae]HBT6083757.1 class I SAM-dependent DNA methyltransferase [Klebsiella quasipneumoniae]HBT6129001.1 class I SAM-dependent DNA methyltransferase [Klebsiella quasipneumoniae]HBT6222762.1 class I SAM-dependent DNA methyltransferase [Klebsiella quasipneumoniae]HBT6245645.1 class I SAM-dependent DNA methyltransferase [Klebsiella quasipneumoniae]HDG7908328.1 class I SAM-dependent DNA methyltransferase [Klebsiella quasipneumoniae]